jgi:hypothetical protein
MQMSTTSRRSSEEVVRWRLERLAESGFSPALAARVAEDPDYDLHALIELVERGCAPDLALRILAPVEKNPAA